MNNCESLYFNAFYESVNRLLISPTANVALGPGFEHSKVHQKSPLSNEGGFFMFIIFCESENRLLISPTANVALSPGFEHSKVHQIKSALKRERTFFYVYCNLLYFASQKTDS